MEAWPALRTGVGSDAMSAHHGVLHLLLGSQTAHHTDVQNLQVEIYLLPNDYRNSAVSMLL